MSHVLVFSVLKFSKNYKYGLSLARIFFITRPKYKNFHIIFDKAYISADLKDLFGNQYILSFQMTPKYIFCAVGLWSKVEYFWNYIIDSKNYSNFLFQNFTNSADAFCSKTMHAIICLIEYSILQQFCYSLGLTLLWINVYCLLREPLPVQNYEFGE